MPTTKTHLRSYADCINVVGNRGTKKLAGNLIVYSVGDTFVVRYHETDIVTYHADGTVELNAGRWLTASTRRHINECAPVQVFQKARKWFVATGGKTLDFNNGMRVAA
jgi:hypothetical protein